MYQQPYTTERFNCMVIKSTPAYLSLSCHWGGFKVDISVLCVFCTPHVPEWRRAFVNIVRVIIMQKCIVEFVVDDNECSYA